MSSAYTGIVHQPRGQTTLERLLLEEVRVNAWVVDVSARIVLVQTFYNTSDESTGRAKYVFPLPANAAVCAFELELEDGTIIVGEVKEKEEAAFAFNRAVEQGRTAALVETVTDDIFTISVGSIPATTRVTAHLTFVMDLLDEAVPDHVRLQLPMYIAERYGTPPEAMRDASAANNRTRVHINVDIQASDVIYDVGSPTHQNQIKYRYFKGHSGRKSRRRMSAVWKSPEFLNSDFVITIYAEGLDKPRCFAEVLDASGTTAMQLTLVPKFQAPRVLSQEYIFIIDRSGSMSSQPIQTAKRTLTMLLRLLPRSQTTFNIFSFGSHVTSLWQSSRGLDNASLAEATSHVAGMDANYGGTEIPGALRSAFDSRGLDRPAAVFLLTDGQIHGNETLDPWQVISGAVQNSPPQAPVRLFVLGIGPGVSSDVCSSLARQGNGEYLFALNTEDISGKCARLLNAGRSKNIERIDIDWGYNASSQQIGPSSAATSSHPASIPALAPPPSVQQAPHLLTRIFSGIRFTVFAITSFQNPPTSIRLRTKLEGVSESKELNVPVSKVKPFRDTSGHSIIPIVHTLAARKLIMELDDGVGPLPTPAPGDALLVSENDLLKAGIVRLGLTYQLVSKHTSFVAVQRGDESRRIRGRRSKAWIRSRLRQTDPDSQADSIAAEDPTLLESLLSGVSSIITSFIGFLGGSVVPTGPTKPASHPRSQHRPMFPGAFDESDSGTGGDSGDRGRRPRGRSPASHYSADTFSTLSSFDGSTCSACWTSSRSPSPLPPLHDPIDRAPSPEFHQDTSAQGPSARPSGRTRPHTSISQDTYALFNQMELDGSFAASPLLARLVGEAVLEKANELGIDMEIWATAVAAAYMTIHLQAEPDLLELVLDKAKEFVGADGTHRFDRLVRQAAALLNP